MELLVKVKNLKVGEKITIQLQSWIGSVSDEKVTYMGEIRHHGYYKRKQGGSWALSPCEIYNIPCYKIQVKPYKKRTIFELALNGDIKEIELGW